MYTNSQSTGAKTTVVLDGKILDDETIATQRAVWRARARMARFLLSVLGIGLLVIFAASYWISRNAAAEPGLTFFLLLAALLVSIVYFANNFWQWRILRVHDLRCPHCRQPLGGESHWTKRPSYACPHCGKDAIATARQLGAG
jgi:hypothetical protein